MLSFVLGMHRFYTETAMICNDNLQLLMPLTKEHSEDHFRFRQPHRPHLHPRP